MRPALPISARVILAVLVFGLLGHLSWELGDRLAARLGLRAAMVPVETSPAHARSAGVRRLARARAALESNPLQGEQVLVSIARQSQDQEIRDAAVAALVAHAQSQWPHDQRGAFMARVAGAAIQSGASHRIPPSITVAQAILESGWGRSRLARNHHNLFGVKANTRQAGVVFPTLEYTQSGVRVEPARFRTYTGPDESMAEHTRLLANDARYAQARAHAMNWRAFLTELAPVYATNPRYPGRITQLIERYGLDRWDAVVGPLSIGDQET